MRIDDELDIYNKQRKVMHFDQIGINHLIRLGKVCNNEFRPALPEHTHRDSFELVFFQEGEQNYMASGQNYLVHSHELFLTYPNEPHGSLAFKEEKSKFFYLIFYFPSHLEHFMGLSRESSDQIRKALYGTSKRVYSVNTKILGLLDGILQLYFSEQPLRKELIYAKALELFSELIPVLTPREESPAERSPIMDHIIAFIEQNPMRPIQIEDLAEHVNLSVPRVKQLFKEQSGLTPHDYMLRYRIGLGKDMLRYTELPITEIAFQLGFNSSQHFSTAFHKYTMETPSEYRKQCRKNQNYP